MLMGYDVAVVTCCAILFSLNSVWDEFDRNIYPRVAPLVMPVNHIAVMSSVYCTILLR